MKLLTAVACLALTVIGFAPAASAQQDKVKVKDERIIVRDKSKPVRRALEEQYAKLAEANKNKDLQALLALRTPGFSAKFPNGEIKDSAYMAGYSRILFHQMQAPISLSNTIETLEVNGNEAIAVVHQRFARMQVKGGQLHRVETEARQRETWVLTGDGWKLKFVDDVHPGAWYVDGRPVDPSKPYDPAAPPYNPDATTPHE
ncbi:MAG: hypothetical protein QOE77_2701 [Blastocatellia bacterium]|jgi:ketosteroid isomerase-like protein|nr:hypothetical protein [Blastocatellia bacterium]